MNVNQADYDSPWKEILDIFFEAAFEFFFPAAHEQIDWSRGYEFLDKELQKITADAALGRRVVDKLAKVWLKNGTELWVLVHVEVQGQRETNFAERIYVYHSRLFNRFNAPVATFVIFTDEEEHWRPAVYETELLGTELRLKFVTAKLTDYRQRLDELEQSANPFAVVVQAHLIAQQTRDDARARMQLRLAMTRRLYQRGFSKQQIIGLFRFLDWVLTLPEELSDEFDEQLTVIEEEQKMEYITSTERRGMKKEAVNIAFRLLQQRFGALDEATQSHIRALPLTQAEELIDSLLSFSSLAELKTWLQQHPLPATATV
ncbi:MAG: DUF4351 domain-containing protein [Acidobacteria bacterium]|nr:DUF4351 domain-containing protein [Acidobacteriota bacterium]